MTVAAAVALPFGVGAGSTKLLVVGTLGTGIAVGMLSSAIPYSLELKALRRLSTATFGVLMSLEPAVAALAGALVVGQAVTFKDAIGIGLVCVASLGASLTSNPPPEPLNIAA
jgi:inner membrane transporter RhtA